MIKKLLNIYNFKTHQTEESSFKEEQTGHQCLQSKYREDLLANIALYYTSLWI